MMNCHFESEWKSETDYRNYGERPLEPLARHAELSADMAGSMASFLLATFEAKARAASKVRR
jgi:hypothetical protein